MDKNRIKGLIYASFIGDALSLGPHWIYNTDDIKKYYYPITGYTAPIHTPYHQGKAAGDFTHYGDQSLLLLKTISKSKSFDIVEFKKQWLDFMETKELYLDHATRTSLKLLKTPDNLLGSDSDELGGFSRSAPLFALPDVDFYDFHQEIFLTHNNVSLLEISNFFVEVIREIILYDRDIIEAIEKISMNHGALIRDAIEKAKAESGSIIDAVTSIGQSCSSAFGLPSVLTILYKSKDNYFNALIENVYAGGDSAARGMLLGMLIGAYTGYEKLPTSYIDDLSHRVEIDEYMKELGF